jgi:hypothetical protein
VNLAVTADCSVYLILTHWYWLRIIPFTWCGHTDIDCGLFRLPDVDILILTADCSVYLMWTYWYWLRIVLFIWCGHANIDCGLFRLPDVDMLILTADCSVYLMWTCWYWLRFVLFTWCGHTDIDWGLFCYWSWLTDFEIGLTAGVAGQQRMLTPPWHLVLHSHLSEVRVALHSICIFPLDFDYILHIVIFAILYCHGSYIYS